MLKRFWTWLKNQIVQDVPEDLDACETCRVEFCTADSIQECPLHKLINQHIHQESETCEETNTKTTV
jgi:hypothetical protein